MNAEEFVSDPRSSMDEKELFLLLSEISERNERKKIPKHPDMVYLIGQTKENQESVIARAREFPDVQIGIGGEDDTEALGYPGFSPWKKRLEEEGISSQLIVPVFGTFSISPEGTLQGNTLTEARALVRYAKDHRFKKIVLVASLFHMPRAFMTVVGVILKEYPGLHLYARNGTELPWYDETVHSQGKVTGVRLGLMGGEMQRLSDYHAQGNIPSPQAVREYIRKRDAEDLVEGAQGK